MFECIFTLWFDSTFEDQLQAGEHILSNSFRSLCIVKLKSDILLRVLADREAASPHFLLQKVGFLAVLTSGSRH